MRQSWKLNIRDFGKVREAQIELAPFVLFVGENNSGKSYLVSLIWGLLAEGRFLFPKDVPATQEYRLCADYLSAHLDDEHLIADETFIENILAWFNALLKTRKNELVKKIFSNPDMTIGQVYLSDYRRARPLQIKWQDVEDGRYHRISSGADYVRFPVNRAHLTEADKFRMIQYISWKLIMDDLSAPLFPMNPSPHKRAGGEALYLPAARTGFMLTYKSLTADLMNSWGGSEQVNSTFTLPVVRFLQGLIESRHSIKGKYRKAARFLEENLLAGTIVSRERAVADYRYQPKNSQALLPFHITSSLVVELSPLAIFLNSHATYRSLIIEEPEAHLHPKLQIMIARLMVHLVNAGLPLFCTTHSDTVLQQVNNLIKLSGHKNQKEMMAKYGYEAQDLLSRNKVKAYQFVVEKGVVVKPLALTEQGFEVPTFNNALIALAEETIELSEGDS